MILVVNLHSTDWVLELGSQSAGDIGCKLSIRLSLLSARPAVTIPAAGNLCCLANTKLHVYMSVHVNGSLSVCLYVPVSVCLC